jgi:hypothetical protein
MNLTQIINLGIDPAARLGNALNLANYRLALMVFKFNGYFTYASPKLNGRITTNIALTLQNFEHIGTKSRSRRTDGRLTSPLSITDTG